MTPYQNDGLEVQVSRGPVFLSAIVAFLLIVLNLWLSVQTAEKVIASADLVSHTHRAIKETEDVLTLLSSAESAVRGFIITGNEQHLSSLDSIIEEFTGESFSLNSLKALPEAVTHQLNRLTLLVSDNPIQLEQANELREISMRRVDRIMESLRIARAGGIEGVREQMTSLAGLRMMDRIRELAYSIANEERVLLKSRQDDLESAHRFNLVSALGSGLAVLFALGLHFLLTYQQHKQLVGQAEVIRANGELMQFTFDSAPIGIINASLDGTIERVNEKFCEIIRMDPKELIGKELDELTHPEDRNLNQSVSADLFDGKSDTYTINKRYQNPRGEIAWVNATAKLVRDTDAKPVSVIATVSDISEQRKAEETRVRMSAIVNNSHDAMITKDLNGIVKSWNVAATKMFGYSELDMVGSPIFKVVPDEKHSEELELLRKASLRETIEPFRTERIRRDGTRVEVLLNVSPLIDSDGSLLGLSTIARDLTAETRAAMELRESEKRFRLLADNMSQFAWMARPDGTAYWFNKRWYDYTGTTFEEVEGLGWLSVHHPDHVDRIMESAKRSWETGKPFEETFPIRGKDGTYRWFLARALPVRDTTGQITQWFGSHTDITEIIENEVMLENARRTAELATKARGEFLANMSHEIRTPMTAILGHTEILADHITDPDDLQSVDTIRRNGKFLLQIINDILDLSKIDAGRFEVERRSVAAAEILQEIRSLLDVRAAEKQLSLEVKLDGSIPYSIQTDPVRLRQILVNLVGNAIKFTDQGSVELTCKYDSERNQMEFRVVDTGIGIDGKDLQRLFSPFEQADSSSTREFEGTGLGLAISKRLAEMLGGTIRVTSEVGKGSDFSLEIDCGAIGQEPWVREIHSIIPPAQVQRFAKIDGLILVVDDRRDIRLLAQTFLEKAGARVILATNGKEAIDRLMSPKPEEPDQVDAVLMDMQMPVMDGYTAAKRLRELGFKKPIIALTANAMKDDRDKCLRSGCDDYATKPLDGSTLVHIIASHMRQNRSPHIGDA